MYDSVLANNVASNKFFIHDEYLQMYLMNDQTKHIDKRCANKFQLRDQLQINFKSFPVNILN